MNRTISALLLALGLIGFSSNGIAGEGCIYGSKFQTEIETTTDETPATVIIEEEGEQDPT